MQRLAVGSPNICPMKIQIIIESQYSVHKCNNKVIFILPLQKTGNMSFIWQYDWTHEVSQWFHKNSDRGCDSWKEGRDDQRVQRTLKTPCAWWCKRQWDWQPFESPLSRLWREWHPTMYLLHEDDRTIHNFFRDWLV